MHCAGRQCALCDQMKVAQRTKKALKDTPRESYQLYHTWRRWRGALISRHTALARRVVHFSPDGDACLQGPIITVHLRHRSTFRRSNSAVCGGQAGMDSIRPHFSPVRCRAGRRI